MYGFPKANKPESLNFSKLSLRNTALKKKNDDIKCRV